MNKKSIPYIILTVLTLAVILIWSVILSKDTEGLEVFFFDIGQGSAALIRDSSGNEILIDGGPDNKILSKLAEEMPYMGKKIDLIILTHPDSDHINGALETLKNYKVAGVLEPCIRDNSAAYQEWQKIIKERELKRVCAHFGQRIKMSNEAKIDILFPLFSIEDKVISNSNDASILARLDYGENCFLLTGDAPKKTESLLVRMGLNLDCEILQIGHHGSKTSTSQEFVEAVSPEVAVISAGKDNRYSLPHQEVLDRLKGVKVYRTDLDGDVEFECDRASCRVGR